MSYSVFIQPHEKSVDLGGARILFPVEPALTQAFAHQIRMTIQHAEKAAYQDGYAQAKAEIRKALGINT